MKSVPERIKEFVIYHKTGDGECNGVLLKAWADKNKLNKQERFDLAYFYSLSYCIPSAILLLQRKEEITKDPKAFAAKHQKDLIFQSDRRYVKCNNAFEKMLIDYTANIRADKFTQSVVKAGQLDFEKAMKEVGKWYFFGRFGCFLFIETLGRLNGYKVSTGSIVWKDGDTATSGLMNLFGLDKSADYFDKTGKIPPNLSQEKLDQLLHKVQAAIRKTGGVESIAEVETSLCAYRKFYKGSRYNGYYLDRQLEELNHYKGISYTKDITKELFALRRMLFNAKYLGEIGGWKGVRKECKTLYKRTGKTM